MIIGLSRSYCRNNAEFTIAQTIPARAPHARIPKELPALLFRTGEIHWRYLTGDLLGWRASFGLSTTNLRRYAGQAVGPDAMHAGIPATGEIPGEEGAHAW